MALLRGNPARAPERVAPVTLAADTGRLAPYDGLPAEAREEFAASGPDLPVQPGLLTEAGYSSPMSARLSRSSLIRGSSLGRVRSSRSTVPRSSARASPYRPSRP
jgi:hypothetical protein